MLTRDNFVMLRKCYIADRVISNIFNKYASHWYSDLWPGNLAQTLCQMSYIDRVAIMATLRHYTWVGRFYTSNPHTISDIMSDLGSVKKQLSQEKSFVLIVRDWDEEIDRVYTLSIEDGRVLSRYSRPLS